MQKFAILIVAALVMIASGQEKEDNCDYCKKYMERVWTWAGRMGGMFLAEYLCGKDESPANCNALTGSLWSRIAKEILFAHEDWTTEAVCEKDYKCADQDARVIYPPTDCMISCKAQVTKAAGISGQRKLMDEGKVKKIMEFLEGDQFCGKKNADCHALINNEIPFAMEKLEEFFMTGGHPKNNCYESGQSYC